MKFNTLSPLKVLLLCIVSILQFSCSKDSDLLTDYVLADAKQELIIGKFVVADTFITTIDNPIVLDVLANDAFENTEEVLITETTAPTSGSVAINTDNSITYTPETTEATVDTFTYTAEIIVDETVSTETATVTVTVEDPNKSSQTMDLGELKAFPTAEGFGRYTTGGRGGKVIHVTNLNDSGTGSLREALGTVGPRYVVFDTGGTINLNNYISAKGDVTIAGETAPGGGILVKGGEIRFSHAENSNVIMRHIRIRRGTNVQGAAANSDCLRFVSYVENEPVEDIIVDHCSFSWPLDESIYFGRTTNSTLQNSITSNSSKTTIIQYTRNFSFLNNFTAFAKERNILANTSNHTDFTFEQHNNIIYGQTWGSTASYGLRFNLTHNKFVESGDQEVKNSYAFNFNPPNTAENNDKGVIETTIAYINNNDFEQAYSTEYDPEFEPYITQTPYSTSGYSPTPTSGLEAKLLSHVGAGTSAQGKDQVDSDAVSDYYSKTGSTTFNNYPTIATGKAYEDSDNDDMWDIAEIAIWGNITTTNNPIADKDGDGYTDIEETFFYFTGE